MFIIWFKWNHFFCTVTFKYLAVVLLDTNTSLIETEGQAEDVIMGQLLIVLDVVFMVGGFVSVLSIVFVMNSAIRDSLKAKHEMRNSDRISGSRGSSGISGCRAGDFHGLSFCLHF